MNDKVKESLEWVAKWLYENKHKIREEQFYARWEDEIEASPYVRDYMLKLAKQILSHPDLALIDRGTYPLLLIDFDKRAFKWCPENINLKPVIPLAEAIKENYENPGSNNE